MWTNRTWHECFLKSNRFKERFAVIWDCINDQTQTVHSDCQSFRASCVLLNTACSRHGLISLALMSKTLFNIQKGIISILKSKAVSVQRLNQQHILIHVVNYKMNCINAAAYRVTLCLFLAYIVDSLCFLLLVEYFTKANAFFCFLLIMKLKVCVLKKLKVLYWIHVADWLFGETLFLIKSLRFCLMCWCTKITKTGIKINKKMYIHYFIKLKSQTQNKMTKTWIKIKLKTFKILIKNYNILITIK